MDKLWKHDAEWKKEEDHMLYKSIYMKCLEQANPGRQKVDEWLPPARGEGMRATANGVDFLEEMMKMF